MNKKIKNNSLFKTLSIILFLNITVIVSINFFYNYNNTKLELEKNINQLANFKIINLKQIVSYYIESFSVDEYEKLLSHQIEQQDIKAIIIKDYNMRQVLGKELYITGKIKDSSNNIKDYDSQNPTFKKALNQSFLVKKTFLFNQQKVKIGELEIYMTDYFINKKLDTFIDKTIIEMSIFTILLFFIMFISLKKFLLIPLYNIVKTIEDKNKDGLPKKPMPTNGPKELVDLSLIINKMLLIIKDSKQELIDLNTKLEEKIDTKVNQLRDKEQILIQQSKLASMGEMIGNIAHQWRQPLTATKATIQAVEFKDRLGKLESSFIREKIKEASELIDYMSNTIDDFRNFFLPSKNMVEFELNMVFESINTIVASGLKNNNIELVLDKDINNIKILGYPNEFKQVVINIINNAKDAIKSRIDKSQIEKGLIEVKISDYDKNEFEIQILDNGGGIPQDIKNKIFEPYFTTKFESNGTGLGLYMSKTIIETNMGGKLIVEDIENGTKFIIRLKTL
jgi:signal transduction histidine kinase